MQSGAVADGERAVDAGGRGDATQDKFRIKPTAAFLEIAAIRHLRDQIRGAKQMPQLPILRIRELNHVELDFVTGEMTDPRGNRYPGFHADARQVACEKARAARHMI